MRHQNKHVDRYTRIDYLLTSKIYDHAPNPLQSNFLSHNHHYDIPNRQNDLGDHAKWVKYKPNQSKSTNIIAQFLGQGVVS